MRVGMMGFSGGAYTSLRGALNAPLESRPNLVAAIYGALPGGATVTAATPPVFIAAASDDRQVPSIQATGIYDAWRRANASAELHIFQNGGHGFDTRSQGKGTDQWLAIYANWLARNGFIRETSTKR